MQSIELRGLVGEIQRRFGVDMSVAEAAGVNTVGQAVEYVLAHRAAPILDAEARRILREFEVSEKSSQGTDLLDAYTRLRKYVAAQVVGDSDQTLTMEEFAAGAREIARTTGTATEPLKPTISAIVNVAENSKSGAMDREQYPRLMRALGVPGSGQTEQYPRLMRALGVTGSGQTDRAFSQIDTDRDGILSADELLNAVRDYQAGALEDVKPLGESVLSMVSVAA